MSKLMSCCVSTYRRWCRKPRYLFTLLVSVFIFLITTNFFFNFIPRSPRPKKSIEFQEFRSIPRSKIMTLYGKERFEFRISVPMTCPDEHLCISFGTPVFGSWNLWLKYFSNFASCEVPRCKFVSDPRYAHAVVLHSRDMGSNQTLLQPNLHDPRQRWIYFSWESPTTVAMYGYNIFRNPAWRFAFNWTATYKRVSDIYTPYGLLQRRSSHETSQTVTEPSLERKHMAFAVISNCNTPVHRMGYLKELQKYMELHIYGRCGMPFTFKDFKTAAQNYYFYMAFENTRCIDYITEKFWLNGLQSGVVPVVFGALPGDYKEVAPRNSFVSGEDFPTVRDLAAHLKKITANETAYSEFYKWKSEYRISPIDKGQDFFCKLCKKLHTDSVPKVVDLSTVWSLKDCSRIPWRT